VSGAQSEIPGRTPLSDRQLVAIRALDSQHKAHMELLQGLEAVNGIEVDKRALALAITNAQQAHMWAVRAVAKPVF
jgi:hypothetical protein